MRKFFSFAMMSAVALTGAMLFTGCASEDGVAEVNPTFDGEAVKTTFSISLPGKVSTTRMAASTVQFAENIGSFRGMSDIVLIPYADATSRTSRLGTNIVLGENKMLQPSTTNAANAIPSGQLLANSNAVLFNDVKIPVGTSAFLFYGKAAGTDGYAEGYLTPQGLTEESEDIFFNPTPVMPDPTNPVLTVGNALAAYVTAIAGAKAGDDAADAAWYKCADGTTYGNTATYPWYNAALGDLYTSFTSLTPGASAYVQAAVQDLYTSVKDNTDAVSILIKNAILTKATDGGTGILTFDTSLNGYPADNNGMPDGCATLTWDGTPKAASAVTSSTFGGSMTTQDMSKVVYPASLYYFANSQLKTADASRATYYNGTNNWATILGTYDTGLTSVKASTRSVAINDPIQYAVGRLDVTVNALSVAHYYDRKGDEVTIPAAGFQLTGVLIGGQKKVDYQFKPVAGDEYTIYDNTINTTSPASNYVKTDAAAGTNYTLALETSANQEVYVVLEFLNNSDKDFMGVNGVVKAGCKFYMVAQLDPTDGTGYDSSDLNSVFKQDHKTVVAFTFGAGTQDLNTNGTTDGKPDGIADTPGGFANAYVTIPDLRTPQLELGFSVDLHWETGLTFTHTF